MGATTDAAAAATQHHQHQADNQKDDAYGPENADSGDETEEQKYESENNHDQQIPRRAELQTWCREGVD